MKSELNIGLEDVPTETGRGMGGAEQLHPPLPLCQACVVRTHTWVRCRKEDKSSEFVKAETEPGTHRI